MSVEVDTLELEVFEVSPQHPLEDATNGSRARTPVVKRSGHVSRANEEMRGARWLYRRTVAGEILIRVSIRTK